MSVTRFAFMHGEPRQMCNYVAVDDFYKLRDALHDLLEQIDCLDDISYSKDTESYKAEACWNDALSRAQDALKDAT